MDMKYGKIIFLSLCAILMACSSDDQLSDGKAWIELDVSAGEDTRAVQTATELNDWTLIVTPTTTNDSYSGSASGVTAESFNPGVYAFQTYNYPSMQEAVAAGIDEFGKVWGAPYYTGEIESQQLKVGGNAVSIACGRARNAQFKVLFNQSFTKIANITNYKVTADPDGRALVFDETNVATAAAYFMPDIELRYKLSFSYEGVDKEAYGTVTLSAGKSSTLNVKANNTGTISLSITYDDSWDEDVTGSVLIDAATGNKAN